jgi:hypothetical protein
LPSLDLDSGKDSEKDVEEEITSTSCLSPKTKKIVTKVAEEAVKTAMADFIKQMIASNDHQSGRCSPAEFPHVEVKARFFYSTINIKMLLLTLVKKPHSWIIRTEPGVLILRKRYPGTNHYFFNK